MGPSDEDVRESARRLQETPRHFRRAASGLTDAVLRHRPADGAWSANEVLAHLRGAADVQGGWIARMLDEDNPTIRYASPRTGMRKGGYASEEFATSLRDFTRQRTALVETLSALALGDWSRNATFTGTKPGWTITVFDAAQRIIDHEHAHFEQIADAVGRGDVRSPRR